MIDHKRLAADAEESIALFGKENASPAIVAHLDLRRLVKEYFDAGKIYSDFKLHAPCGSSVESATLYGKIEDARRALRAAIGEE